MGSLRKGKLPPLAVPDHKDSFAKLRHTIIRSVELGDFDPIVCAAIPVDSLDRTLDQLQAFTLLAISKPWYILEQEGFGESIAQDPEIGGHGSGAGVVQPQGVARCPVA